MLWFANGAFASLAYNGYGHFDSNEWTGWIGEMGNRKDSDEYGSARRHLKALASKNDEALLKNAGTYGGATYNPPADAHNASAAGYQHFGPIIVSCEGADIRPLPDAIYIYGNEQKERRAIAPPTLPRSEVIDELYRVVVEGQKPLHDGNWARDTLKICLAILDSSTQQRDIDLL
jgi:phthalate 4,5-cis-dihydrodiol dehydrogenase